jgi:hypothetical protein
MAAKELGAGLAAYLSLAREIPCEKHNLTVDEFRRLSAGCTVHRPIQTLFTPRNFRELCGFKERVPVDKLLSSARQMGTLHQ